MDYILALIVGIGSSLIATGIFIGASELVRRVVLPWWADKIYRGVRIDGRWCLALPEKDDDESSDRLDFTVELSLQQRGDRVFGTSSIINSGERGNSVIKHIISGTIRDSYFFATAVPESPHMIDPATYLFRVSHDQGLTLDGCALYLDQRTGEVRHDRYMPLKRQEV